MTPAGESFGPYRVISPLGHGGMGEVYLAEDARLHRRVALKLLPSSTQADEASRLRLMREAQAVAALEHTNICTVYDVGEAGGRSFIAMQYVEGETLAARLARRKLTLGDAVSIAAQVAAALSEAHRHGIVHRDIKPQNIMLSSGNHVTVLDFGLAKLTEPLGTGDGSDATLTASHAIVGTVPYMSPEQVRNETLDVRTDVFSFGIVLYEMLRAVHPFWSGSAGETMSAILTREPPALESVGPPELRRIVRKCLEKDRERRYQSVHDLAIDLENVARDLSSGTIGAPETDGVSGPGSRRVGLTTLVIAGVALLGVAGAAILMYARSARRSEAVPQSEFIQLTEFPDATSAPSLSPDGRMVAFIRGGDWFLSRGQIYVKLLPGGDARQLTHDDTFKYGPTFTPDGSRVTYTGVSGNAEALAWDTWSVPVLGGEPTRLLPNASGLSWLDDRRVIFSELQGGIHMGIVTATLDRTSERTIYLPAHERAMAHFGRASPDRKWVLVVEMDRTGDWLPCRVVPFDGSSAGRRVGPEGPCIAAEWSKDGRTMYFNAATDAGSHLWRQRFPDGTPEPLTSGSVSSEHGLALDPDGRSIVTAVGRTQSSLWVHDARGDRLLPLEGAVSPSIVSADGTRIYCIVDKTTGLTIVDAASGRIDRVLTEFPIIDFDVQDQTQTVAFTTAGAGGERQIWLASLDRRSAPRQVLANADSVQFAGAKGLLFRSLNKERNFLEEVRLDGSGRRRVLDRPIVDLESASPDGTVAVISLPATDRPVIEKVAVSTTSAVTTFLCSVNCSVRWSGDGHYVYINRLSPNQPGRETGTVVIPLSDGQSLPPLPVKSGDGAKAWQALPGVQVIDRGNVDPGPDPAVYVFRKIEQLSNLFRVRIE